MQIEERDDRVRTYDLGNNKAFIKQTDPYGFIYITLERGQLPDKLQGAYTSYDYAERDLKRYLQDKKRKVVEEKKEPIKLTEE